MKGERQMGSVKLSILICTMPERRAMLDALIITLNKQINRSLVDIDANGSVDLSIGQKRNELLDNARGEYVCFIDDDDEVASDYIPTILESLSSSPDCLSLRGVMTWDGQNPELFEHSIKYDKWITTINSIKYERYPNHLNVIKSSIAKEFKFPEINFGEDHDWAKQIHESGLLKHEVYIDKVLYNYKYVSNK